jgi:hypothetical protein
MRPLTKNCLTPGIIPSFFTNQLVTHIDMLSAK